MEINKSNLHHSIFFFKNKSVVNKKNISVILFLIFNGIHLKSDIDWEKQTIFVKNPFFYNKESLKRQKKNKSNRKKWKLTSPTKETATHSILQ